MIDDSKSIASKQPQIQQMQPSSEQTQPTIEQVLPSTQRMQPETGQRQPTREQKQPSKESAQAPIQTARSTASSHSSRRPANCKIIKFNKTPEKKRPSRQETTQNKGFSSAARAIETSDPPTGVSVEKRTDGIAVLMDDGESAGSAAGLRNIQNSFQQQSGRKYESFLIRQAATGSRGRIFSADDTNLRVFSRDHGEDRDDGKDQNEIIIDLVEESKDGTEASPPKQMDFCEKPIAEQKIKVKDGDEKCHSRSGKKANRSVPKALLSCRFTNQGSLNFAPSFSSRSSSIRGASSRQAEKAQTTSKKANYSTEGKVSLPFAKLAAVDQGANLQMVAEESLRASQLKSSSAMATSVPFSQLKSSWRSIEDPTNLTKVQEEQKVKFNLAHNHNSLLDPEKVDALQSSSDEPEIDRFAKTDSRLPQFRQKTTCPGGQRFNIMVCGASGLGKSNFVEFMLKQVDFELATQLLESERSRENAGVQESQTLGKLTQQIKSYSITKEYKRKSSSKPRKSLHLSMIDTPGYGSLIHADMLGWQKLITQNIKTRLIEHHQQERQIRTEYSKDPVVCNRKLKQIVDQRVHLVLYFFGGSHTMKDADFKMLQKLSKVVNVLPIVSMADSFTADELFNYKKEILRRSAEHKINFFNCEESLNELALVDSNGQADQVHERLLRSPKSGVCPPFAIVNPQFTRSAPKQDRSQRKRSCSCSGQEGHQMHAAQRLGREKIHGFVDATSADFDFGQLYQLLFGYLTQTFIETSDFFMQNFVQEYYARKASKEEQQIGVARHRRALFGSKSSRVLPTVLSGAFLGTLYFISQQKK